MVLSCQYQPGMRQRDVQLQHEDMMPCNLRQMRKHVCVGTLGTAAVLARHSNQSSDTSNVDAMQL